MFALEAGDGFDQRFVDHARIGVGGGRGAGVAELHEAVAQDRRALVAHAGGQRRPGRHARHLGLDFELLAQAGIGAAQRGVGVVLRARGGKGSLRVGEVFEAEANDGHAVGVVAAFIGDEELLGFGRIEATVAQVHERLQVGAAGEQVGAGGLGGIGAAALVTRVAQCIEGVVGGQQAVIGERFEFADERGQAGGVGPLRGVAGRGVEGFEVGDRDGVAVVFLPVLTGAGGGQRATHRPTDERGDQVCGGGSCGRLCETRQG